MSDNEFSWNEWGRHVLEEMKNLKGLNETTNNKLSELEKYITKIDVRFAAMEERVKNQSRKWGTLSGIISAIAVSIIGGLILFLLSS